MPYQTRTFGRLLVYSRSLSALALERQVHEGQVHGRDYAKHDERQQSGSDWSTIRS